MIKRVICLFLLLMLIWTISFAKELEEFDSYLLNNDTGYAVIINDEASLLDKEELDMLSDDMYSLTAYGNIVFLSIDYPTSGTEHDVAHDFYYDLFNTQSGTLLLIDMHERVVCVYADGENLKKVTPEKATIITDNIYRYLSNGKYFDGAKVAYNQIYKLLGGDKIPEPMRYTSNALIATTLGFFITFMIGFTSTKIAAASSKDILKKTKVKFVIRSSDARKDGERKVYSPISESSSSSGHSSGGSYRSHSAGHSSHSAGHSSHSSGGSGSHRF